MWLKRNLTHFCIAELCNCLKNTHRSWLAHMSLQLKVNGFGLPANCGSRRRHILKHEKTLETRLHGDQWPLPPSSTLPSPRSPLFSGIVYLLSFVMASRKIHFKEEKKFWIVDVLFIYIYQSITWISAFEAAEKHKIMVTWKKVPFLTFFAWSGILKSLCWRL